MAVVSGRWSVPPLVAGPTSLIEKETLPWRVSYNGLTKKRTSNIERPTSNAE